MKEIEKKYLVKDINLDNYDYIDIKQAYLNARPDPIIRIRKYNDEYFLTYKRKIKTKELVNVADEYELPINEEIFNKLKEKIEGNVISKRRYLIKLDDDLTAELDVYEGYLKGLKTVEVEFKTEEDYLKFKKPDWFLDDVTRNKKYINASLAMINNLEELGE